MANEARKPDSLGGAQPASGSLQALKDQIGVLFVRDANNRIAATRFVRGALIIFGTSLAGYAQLFPTAPGGMAYSQIAGLVGVGLALFGGIWALWVEQSAPEALEQTRKALEKASEVKNEAELERTRFEGERAKLNQSVATHALRSAWLSDLYVTYNGLREFLESWLAEKKPFSNAHLQKMLDSVARPLQSLLGFEAGELWTLAIYKFEAGFDGTSGKLVSVANQRADRRDEQKPHRVWGVGEGLVGHVHLTARETVIGDATDPERAGWLHFPQGLADPQDAKRYRSMAGVPVRISANEPLWGVVMATSDKVGRFRTAGPERSPVEPLRMLAGIVALGAATDYLTHPVGDGLDSTAATPQSSGNDSNANREGHGQR